MRKKYCLKKILLTGMLCTSLMAAISGCGNKDTTADSTIDMTTEAPSESVTEGTVADILLAQFKAEVTDESDVAKLADSLSKNEVFGEMVMATMDVEEGFLNGFNEEIEGFNKGTMFSPMIGTIPFVGYIFETDTPDDLMKTLNDKHQLNWNICTTADEMKVDCQGNYVFFVMSPESFE